MPKANTAPSNTAPPKAPPKIVVINPNPSGQAKITQARFILAAIQVDARACRIDIPEMSMSIMEDAFDEDALAVSSYIVALPQAAKNMVLEEGELCIPVDDEEVRLDVFDANEDGIKIERQESDKAHKQLKHQGHHTTHKKPKAAGRKSSAYTVVSGVWIGSSSGVFTKQGLCNTK